MVGSRPWPRAPARAACSSEGEEFPWHGKAVATAGAPDDRQDGELVDRLVSVNRVAKVVKGGRRFGFSALVVVGDGKGRVGYGSGKAREVPEAVRKATEQAKRGMVRVPLRQGRTLHHDIIGHFGAGRVLLRTAPPGTGIIAGGPMRAVCEALGIDDVVGKSLGSTNPHNMVKATFDALVHVVEPASDRRQARPQGRATSSAAATRGERRGQGGVEPMVREASRSPRSRARSPGRPTRRRRWWRWA